MLAAMDRVLLLMTATSYKASAFLEAARRLGVAVTVASDRAQALAEVNPAGHLTLDFADAPHAARTIAAFAASHPVRALIAADDDGTLIAALAAMSLGLEHHPPEAVRAARSKLATRERLAAAGLPGPWFERVALAADPEATAARLRYPCVLKPLALSASRGVMRADDPAAFAASLRRLRALLARPDACLVDAAPDAWAMVEGYLPGREVAVEGLMTHGRLRALAIFDKPDPLEGPFFEETIYVTPSRLDPRTQGAVLGAVGEATRALGLTHGPVHAELRVSDGRAWVLEIAPRSIGGLCSRSLRFDGDVSLEELILRHALGRDVEALEREPGGSGVMMIPIPARGRLDEVRGIAEARAVPGVTDLRITVPPGHQLEPLPEGARYLGFIFARAERPEEAESALREAHRKLTFLIEPAGD